MNVPRPLQAICGACWHVQQSIWRSASWECTRASGVSPPVCWGRQPSCALLNSRSIPWRTQYEAWLAVAALPGAPGPPGEQEARTCCVCGAPPKCTWPRSLASTRPPVPRPAPAAGAADKASRMQALRAAPTFTAAARPQQRAQGVRARRSLRVCAGSVSVWGGNGAPGGRMPKLVRAGGPHPALLAACSSGTCHSAALGQASRALSGGRHRDRVPSRRLGLLQGHGSGLRGQRIHSPGPWAG